ncbi:protein HUA2-LIKE 2 isoform X2 [Eutrema salsugineum]|uniref:protein HUA2-LIKE 2 isoform X2 n=1 Tax=Eutrema salsugineum TaxID=72664 RepID=UPI000CECF622|nr:protein HUA2-LIKE 2 isoform X2 [Eutrema salsugineum]
MAPSRRKGGGKAAAVAAACRQWKVGDLVLAKVKGFPAWPAAVSEPEKWGYSTDWKKVLVHFFGTQQIAFCNPADVEAFTEEKKQSLLTKRHAKGSDFVRAVKEITESYEKLKHQEQAGDPKSAEETTLGNAGNTTLLPQVSEDPIGTSLDTQIKSDPSHGGDESALLSEDASAAEQMLALRDNSVPPNKAPDISVVNEPRRIATYSSRRRNGGARSQKGAPQKNKSLDQRSKSSSRLQSDKLQSSMLQYSDGGQSIDDVGDGALRRRKRIRRSSGHSESDDVASSTHGSDEENASEIATVESDNNTRNEGNGVDSGSKVKHSDTGGQFLKGDYECNNGLNFQINTMVKKKKRKPTRKRGTSDAVDLPAKVEAEAVLEAGTYENIQTSQNSDERFTERPCEENGDEHLPLVKRARVRMSRAFYVDHEANGSLQVEERSSKDTLVSVTVQTSPSDIVSSQDTSVAGESNIFEVSAAKLSGDMGNVVPSPVEKTSDGMPSSEACVQSVGDREYAMGWNELSKAPYDEAARPQSNQVIRSPTGEAQKASAPKAACPGDSQPMKLPTSDSDLPAVQCLDQYSEIATPLDPNTVDSSENKTSGICSSGIPQLPGHHRSQDEDACDSLDNYLEPLNEEGDRNDACDLLDNYREPLNEEGDRKDACVVLSEALEHSPSSCSMVNKPEAENMQKAENMLLKEEHGRLSEEYDNVNPSHTTPDPPISPTETDVIVDESEPRNETSGEVDNQKQQVQTNNSVSVSENLSREKMSLSPANIADTFARGSPHSNSVYHMSTAESANDTQNNGSCSPNAQSGEKKTVCDATVKEEEKADTGVFQGQKVVSTDVQSTRESFEDALSSLVRTKESIGRATRLAMDLMKFGVSAKAMEILAHALESESNLQRRVDLFFLVDSIAQCSKSLKGDAGCVYLSAIQVILPRLLAAAVPAGATTQENRRQCLKVLRLWLERRILPESIVRHHIRELDSHSIVPACLYSRRSARTERSLDDPVRDMEGMLVDEYGSNSTLQLPGFCMPAMLKDEDGGSDSDGGDFESVTPEHDSRIFEENVSSSTAEKHTLILEDVDGELEMEDVAPPWETGNCTHTDQPDNTTKSTNCQIGQQHPPVSGISHQHVSLSSPPLPSSSPPPPPPPPAPPSQQAQCAMSDSYSNGFDSGGYSNMHGDHQAGLPRMNPPLPGNTMHYQGQESSYSSGVQLTNSMPQADGSNFQHRPYTSHPHPPPPPPQHQYSYTEPDHHMKSRRDGPSYSHRSQYVPNFDERNFHDNHERMRHASYENRDNWRYPPSSSYGSRYQDKHKGPFPSSSYNGGPPRESGRYQNHRWNHPHRGYNNRHSFHPKPHSEGPVPVGMRDPGMWHQRGD